MIEYEPETKAEANEHRTALGNGARFTSRDCGNESGIKCGGDWFNSDQPSISRLTSSKSPARKHASAVSPIAAAKSSTNLPAIVAASMKLVRVAGLLKGCCPFHGEKTPSFVVYDDHFHCYGCGARGDVVDFIKFTHRCDTREALRILGSSEVRQVTPMATPSRQSAFEAMPIPQDAPDPDLRPFDHVYTYRNESDAVLRYICRIDGPPKKIIPLSWGKLDGRVGWHKKHSLNRGLYGLDQIAARPAATVIVCEGEKAADAAASLYPTRVVCTWSGGAQAYTKTDWTPLTRRRVILWPDNDAPGIAAMDRIAEILCGLNARIAVVNTAGLGHGDDAADVATADPEAWLQERIRV